MASLYQVDMPHRFCCGLVAEKYTIGTVPRITKAAPIMRWTIGKTARQVEAWVKKKGGTIRRVA